ncbi:MAG: mannose-6-phosphate isomerase, class I [Spirochaetaceae bacterium]|nr:mannose-6-phosphate isomerase, class I [Spirochaetaceae bacterium]MCF7950075.1 mannose-6-phosphate isomerase, class I [Spirochaetaceae bacterium]
MYKQLFKLENLIQHYPWGSTALIPELLGIQNKPGTPYAEMWMGSHPRGQSKLVLSEENEKRMDLKSAIEESPSNFLGPEADRFSEGLPFLFKVLAAAQPLSIQAHPSRRQAQDGFDREEAAGIPIDAFERNYRDRNHKPEIICALTPFTALCGFRAAAEIDAWYSYLGTTLEDETFKSIYKEKIAPADAPGAIKDAEWLKQFFENIMNLSEKDQAELIELLYSWASAASTQQKEAELVVTFYEQHGVNVGVHAPLYLNVVELSPGEALYQPAGVLHAYVAGMGVELMANSDNVLRGGLTQKHVDVPELLRVISFEPRPADILRGEKAESNLRRYPVPIDEFDLLQIESEESISQRWEGRTSLEIGICTKGDFELLSESGDSYLHIVRGESFIAPYGAGNYTFSGRGELYLATIPAKADGQK